jgi:hypothetical protein
MTDTNKQNIYTLEQNLIEELNDNKKDILEGSCPEDVVSEYADSWVPIYSHDLLSVAQSDLTLGYNNSEGEGDVYAQLTWSIYHRLELVAQQWLQDNQFEVA